MEPQEDTTTVEPSTEEVSTPEIPEKYQKKSVEDLIKMHTEAEKKASRLGNDVGELRSTVGSLQEQLLSKETPPEEVDFYDDPDGAISQKISSSPEMQEIKRMSQKALETQAVTEIKSRHSDYLEVTSDPEFLDWLQGSPTRNKMLVEANANYDAPTFNDMLDMYKSTKTNEATVKAETDKEETRQDTLKKVKSESGSGGGSTRKTYNAVDLQRMQIGNPDKYYSTDFQKELKKAYTEGRVKS